MTKIICKKFMTVILSLAMMISFMPAMTLTVYATDPDPYTATVNDEEPFFLSALSGVNFTSEGYEPYVYGFTQPVNADGHYAEAYVSSLHDTNYLTNRSVTPSNLIIYYESENTEQLCFLADQSGKYKFYLVVGGYGETDGLYTEIFNQEITVDVSGVNITPSFIGATSSLTVNQNADDTDIKGLLDVSDSDMEQTLTWSQSVAPSHGTLNFSNATASSGGTNITPEGTITYKPEIDYIGSDSFTIQVSDGIATATRTINVVVNDVPEPSVTSVSAPTNGTYPIGSNLDYTIHFSEPVNVDMSSGTPYLTLTIGGSTVHADYNSGTGTSEFRFRYTVESGDTDTDGIALSSDITLNGGTIKDAAGNNANVTFTGSTASDVTVDGIAPTVSSINRNSPATETTNADSVTFQVTFIEPVTGVDTSDFTLTATGNAHGTVNSVTDSDDTNYEVTVNSITGSGTLRLDLNDTETGIADVGGTAITAGYSVGQTYTIDKTAPTISSAVRTSDTQITVTLSEACQHLDNADDGGFTVTKTGTATTYAVTGTAQEADSSHVVLTVADMGAAAGAGVTVTYTAGENGIITDTVGNALATDSTGAVISAWDTTAPTVSSINRNSPATETTNEDSVTFQVTFSEPVTGVDTSDFTLTATGNAHGTVNSVTDSDDTNYEVTVNSITGSGTLRLDLNDTETGIADVGGTAITAGYSVGQTYTIDKTAPTISSAVRTSDTQITVTLSEACQHLDNADDGGFAVTKTGMDTTYAVTGTAQGADSSHVVLTVADMGAAAGAGVTVTYTAGENGIITDTVGNALATDSTGKTITAWTSTGSGGSYSGSPSNNGAAVIVNGESKTAGTKKTTTNSSGKTVTTITVDSDMLENILASESSGATVIIPFEGNSDAVAGTLTGAMVKSMENQHATLVVKTDSGTYTLPASEINIDTVTQQFGANVSLSDITVTVSISEPSTSMTRIVEDVAQDSGYTIMVPAVDYTITCTHGGRTVSVSTFNSYVERTIAIPEGIDMTRITTGVVINPDGTAHHVPTYVTVIDGKYYAVINSLTNSTYSIIWNPVEFLDVTNHWAKDAINDMGSRMIVAGVGNNNYEPSRYMTRAEFATIIVKALGLEPGNSENGFGDVLSSDWYSGYIKTATDYGIIKGYNNGNFGPNDLITREQAITMVARAMDITGLDADLTNSEISKLLVAFSDSSIVSSYALNSVAGCLKVGIISGASDVTISPKTYITRAEVAVMAQRLLQKSGLI